MLNQEGRDRAWKAAMGLHEGEPSSRLKDFFAVDDRGHSVWFEWFSPIDLLTHPSLSNADLGEIATAWETGVPTPNPVKFRFSQYGSERCSYCDSRSFLCDGFMITAADECPYPKGYEVVSVDIPIPSGRMLFGNDFRSAFRAEDEDDHYVNRQQGIRDLILAYEKVGMAHFFVGNTCPNVYKLVEGDFLIANPPWVDDEENDVEEGEMEGELVGGVLTDLWWVSIVDGDEADNRGLVRREMDEEVAVPPGIYQLDYYGCAKGFDAHGDETNEAVVFARFYKKEGT